MCHPFQLDSRGYLNLQRISVLLVDDHRHTLILLAEVLRGLGVGKIHRAETVSEAFDLLNRRSIDIVLSDIAIGHEDGLDFVRQLRSSADPKIASVPVVVVSSYATSARVMQSGMAGASHFLAKPITVARLAARIAEALRTPRLLARPPLPIEGAAVEI